MSFLICPHCQHTIQHPLSAFFQGEPCLFCLDLLRQSKPFSCSMDSSSASSSFDAFAAFSYQGHAGLLIRAIKYGKLSSRLVFSLLFQVLKERLPEGFVSSQSLLVPIPRHPWRLFRYGYNTSLMLAHALSQELLVPFSSALARRWLAFGSQVNRDELQRQKAIQSAFSLRSIPRQKSIIIMDDVWTTGATWMAAKAVLQEACPDAQIRFLCLAKVGDVDFGA